MQCGAAVALRLAFPRQDGACRDTITVEGHAMSTELERFIEVWEREAAKTEKLLAALPRDGYDFRPDPEGRSLGELAWHLAEAEGYGALGIERGEFGRDAKPDGIARPRTVEELAPGFARVHADAVARV